MKRISSTTIIVAVVWSLLMGGFIISFLPRARTSVSREGGGIQTADTVANAATENTEIVEQPGAPTSTSEVAELGSISGRITDVNASALEGAFALVSSQQGEIFASKTDSRGEYSILGVPPGTYAPVAAKTSYSTTALEPVIVSTGSRTQDVDFILERDEILLPDDAALSLDQESRVRSMEPIPATANRSKYTVRTSGGEFGGFIYWPTFDASNLPVIIALWPNETELGERLWIPLADNGFSVVVPTRTFGHRENLTNILTFLELIAEDRRLGISASSPIAVYGASSASITAQRLPRYLSDVRASVVVGGISDLFLYLLEISSGEYDVALDHGVGYELRRLGTPDQDPYYFMDYSSVFFADSMPPVLIIHSSNDTLVPVNQAYRLAAELNSLGKLNELHISDEMVHHLLPFGAREQGGASGPEGLFWAVLNFYNRFMGR